MWLQLVTPVFAAQAVVSEGSRISSGLLRDVESRITRNDNEPVTLILESLDKSDLHPILSQEGLNSRYGFRDRHELLLPAQRIKTLLGRLPENVWLRESYPHVPAVISQGLELVGADEYHQLSFMGDGVKIGVIDLQFSNYSAAQAAGELPANLVITDYTGTGLGGGTHGTSVAEIVHDMAPNAQLYLAKVATDVQLTQATNALIAAGVKVIVHSVAWFGSSFYDGTGVLCNTTNTAQSNGVLWINAAGNQRNMHYLATFSDTNGDLRHEFSSGQNYNTVTASAGQTVTLILNWDAYPKTKVDYNLYLYNGIPGSGGTLVASSTNVQNAGSGNVPYESLSYSVPAAGTYYIVVQKQQASTASLPFTLFALSHDLSVRTNATSLAQPADCTSTLAVAATNLSNSPEYFSAEGPRWRENGVLKPDIAAPNRVVTSQSSSFAGTSAAAPHVGGLAALLMQENPAATVSDIRQLLINTVRDVNTTGFDYRTGYGRISVDVDRDAVVADFDNCPFMPNTNQSDIDGDLIGDVCDACPDVANDDTSDLDGDGLGAFHECMLGTDASVYDTDGDGLSDGDEINLYLTDPLNTDSDSDGVTDGIEIQAGTNPNLASSLPQLSDGDLTGDGIVDLRDVLFGQQVLIGTRQLSSLQLLRADVAPLVNGQPAADGVFNIADQLVLTRKVLGQVSF